MAPLAVAFPSFCDRDVRIGQHIRPADEEDAEFCCTIFILVGPTPLFGSIVVGFDLEGSGGDQGGV